MSNYLAAFERTGLTYPLPEQLDEAELERRLFPPMVSCAPPLLVLPDFPEIHSQLRLKGVTRQLLWQEYCEQSGAQAYSYTQFCVLYQRRLKRQRLSMRQTGIPAEERRLLFQKGRKIP